jgi:hypothetical protein
MKNIMENLFALQSLQLQSGPVPRSQPEDIEAIRKKIPAGVLTHYDRLVARGKKGVAVVRNGVCSECHISVAIGPLAGLAQEGDVRTCGNCGRYLFLPHTEPVVPAIVLPPVKTARRRKQSLAHAS